MAVNCNLLINLLSLPKQSNIQVCLNMLVQALCTIPNSFQAQFEILRKHCRGKLNSEPNGTWKKHLWKRNDSKFDGF